MKGRGDAKDGHDHRLVLLIDEDFHVPDVLLPRHLGNILVRHVRLSGPGWVNTHTVTLHLLLLSMIWNYVVCKMFTQAMVKTSCPLSTHPSIYLSIYLLGMHDIEF